MGLQKLIRPAAVAALFFLSSCTDLKPVAPLVHRDVDGRAIALARAAVGGLAQASYAYYPRDGFSVDTVRLGTVYSDSLLRRINLFGFVNCMKSSGNCLYVDSAFTPDTSHLFIDAVYPQLYVWGYNAFGFLFDDKIQFFLLYGPAYTLVAIDAPDPFREFQSLRGVACNFFGNFVGSYTADEFACLRQAYTFYPMNSLYDSVEVVLDSRSKALVNDSLPADGVIMRNYYLNSDSSGAHYALPLDSRSALSRLFRYVRFTKKGANDATADTVRDSYYFQGGDTLCLARTPGAVAALTLGDTAVRGTMLADSSYAYLFGSGYSLKFSSLDTAPVPMTVVRTGNDTVFKLALSAGKDSIQVSAYSAGRLDGVQGFVRSGKTLSWTLGDSAWTGTATAYPSLTGVVVSFSRRENGAGQDSFAGWINVNLYTRRGAGYVVDAANGYRYAISVELDRSSRIEDIGL